MTAMLTSSSSSLSLSITNPLVLYRALLATNRIRPDPAQHRLALELQKLYFRLKDYDPEIEYRWRLQKAAKLSRKLKSEQDEERKAVFNDGPNSRRFSMSTIFGIDERAASLLAMTRTIPVHDSAMQIDSPQGMLLYGEVGRGKSMLVDLLFSSLPTKKKRRWHFNTFILDIFRRLEQARIERLNSTFGLGMEHEHVVLSLARDTMETSPILFLDEFQMPDRVSGKLLQGFLTSFFSLGGVLVASSNRMPDELAKASGVEFSRMNGLSRWGRGGQIIEKLSPGQQQARSDWGKFVDLLKKRCGIWEMEGRRDWRREDEQIETSELDEVNEMSTEEAIAVLDTVSDGSITPSQSLSASEEKTSTQAADSPLYYHLTDPTGTPTSEYSSLLSRVNPSGLWEPSTIHVYGRNITLTTTSAENGVAILPFPSLCIANLGPADYISMCSTFHTLIITEVPILTLLQKNEARRFITFLDACYEARCRLSVQAAAPPDRLFFPETRAKHGSGNMLEDGDSIESEAFSEMYQDSTAPFRPNISVYEGRNQTENESESVPNPTTSLYNKDLRSVLADEDADFGPTYGNRRSHGLSSSASDYDSDGSEMLDERHKELQEGPRGMCELDARQGPDFTQGAGIFTGQDEQFAYKRARSRLWEMCGRRWWQERTGRDPTEWWTPVVKEGRFWEEKTVEALDDLTNKQGLGTGEGMVGVDGSHDGTRRKIDSGLASKEKDDALFKHGASPFRTSTEPPPKFGWQHAWGMMTWGKKAGEWGKGVEGDRQKEKDRPDDTDGNRAR